MSTATATVQNEHNWPRAQKHYKTTLRHLWVCTQVNCDGHHHVWLSCGTH